MQTVHLHVPGLDELVIPSRPWIGRVGALWHLIFSIRYTKATEESLDPATYHMLQLLGTKVYDFWVGALSPLPR